jgi:hypothetical protein
MDERSRARWRGSSALVEDDPLCVVRARYRPEAGIGETDVTMLRLDGGWRRTDVRLTQRCYAEEEIRSGVGAAGFEAIGAHDGERDLTFPGGVGRTFFVCEKPTAREG